MADRLLAWAANPAARWVLSRISPLPLPQVLRRSAQGRSPWSARPLEGKVVGLGAGEAAAALAPTLAEAGATLVACGADAGLVAGLGEAWSRPSPGSEATLDALVVDLTETGAVVDLERLPDTLSGRVRGLARCSRVLLLGSPPGDDPHQAAAAGALHGFLKSLAKETGPRGSTANALRLSSGARPGPVATWLLSDASAFVTGQVLDVGDDDAPAPGPGALAGKRVVVTGAARGIGEATVDCLAGAGAEVVLVDRPEEQELLGQVAGRWGGHALALDVAADDAPARLVDALPDGVHAVVHNAGVTRDRTLGRMEPERWRTVMAINLDAILRLDDALVRGPLRDGGRLVYLASVAGIAGNFGQTAYAASKSGLQAAMVARARSLGPRGIRANAVAPGFIETRMTAAIPAVTREAGRRLSALGQGGLPVDVAEAVTFLCTPSSAALQGQTLRVCGGAFLGA